jgi:penicillin G amidase
VTTSNEMNLPAGYPYQERKLSFEWTNSSRHARIDEVLKSLTKVSIEDAMRLQNDVTSIPARRLVALVAPLVSSDSETKAALDLLRGWDAVESADSPQAALMEVWISRYLGRAFIETVLPPKAAQAIGTPDIAVMLDTLEKPDAARYREHLLLTTLAAAYAETEKLEGGDSTKWQWGKLHHALPEHPVLGVAQPGPFPAPGSPYTPNQAAYRLSDFQMNTGPSFRVVLDVGNWDNSRAVNFPGQSGNPSSDHYRDLAEKWLTGQYFPLLYSRDAVEKATELRIVLNPKLSHLSQRLK